VIDTARLRERLVAAFGGETVRHGERRLAVNAVDARTGEVVRYVTASTPRTEPPEYEVVPAITVDMLLASAAIPVLFPAVRINGHQCWDGGLLVNTPLAPVVALGADRIIPVLVSEPPVARDEPLRVLGQALERTLETLLDNAYNVDRKLLLERNRVRSRAGRHYRKVRLYKAIRPGPEACFNAGSYLYFTREALAAMRVAGRRAAVDWLERPDLEDRLEGDEPPRVEVEA